jgi:voltage-gated potassium channel
VTERLDPLMAWLGVVFALLVGYALAVETSARTARTLEILGWAIWAVFLLEFAAKLSLAPDRLRFLRAHWLQALMLVLPTLRLASFLRLLRLGRALPATRILSSSYRAAGTARALLRSRLGYIAALTVVVGIALAELVYLFERDERASQLDSFADAISWSFSVVIALQGDPVPTSAAGRAAMLLGFMFGLVIVASLAGTVGAFLVEERRERSVSEHDGSGS